VANLQRGGISFPAAKIDTGGIHPGHRHLRLTLKEFAKKDSAGTLKEP